MYYLIFNPDTNAFLVNVMKDNPHNEDCWHFCAYSHSILLYDAYDNEEDAKEALEIASKVCGWPRLELKKLKEEDLRQF